MAFVSKHTRSIHMASVLATLLINLKGRRLIIRPFKSIFIIQGGLFLGEKYKSSFLSDKDTKSILEYISEIMVNHGWSFNIYAHGKYSYWKNGPIWEFGDSVEVVEAVIDKYNNINRLVEIIKNISRFYSPLILLDKVIESLTKG